MILYYAKEKFISRAAFSLAAALCFSVGIFAQQSGNKKSAVQPSGAVKLKKAMVIGRKNPILKNPTSRRSNNVIAIGVVNGRARNLVTPNFTRNVKSAVTVQVTIDETGKVTSAKSAEKNPLRRRAAERAARQSTFAPVILRGQSRKASGVIVYKPIS